MFQVYVDGRSFGSRLPEIVAEALAEDVSEKQPHAIVTIRRVKGS